MDSNCGSHCVVCGVDNRDRVRGRVDCINLVTQGIDGHARRLAANLNDSVLTQVDEVKDGNRAWFTVRNIGELAVIGGVIGELAAMAAGKSQRQ